MNKKGVLLVLSMMLIVFLCSCGVNDMGNITEEYSNDISENITDLDSDNDVSITDLESDNNESATNLESNNNESAANLENNVLFVSVFIQGKDASWKEEKIEQVNSNFKVSEKWFEEQAEKNGKTLDVIWDHDDLKYNITIEDYMDKANLNNADDFLEPLNKLISEKIDSNKLKKQYNAENIAFIALIDGVGRSYANPYLYGQHENEVAVCYLYDESEEIYESPALIAHEVLHLFSAEDLYYDPERFVFSKELLEYTEDNYPDSIMLDLYDVYGQPNYREINKEISPINKYLIGWSDETELLEKFPELIDVKNGSYNEELAF